jgi:DNA-binding response OmpR family regulator
MSIQDLDLHSPLIFCIENLEFKSYLKNVIDTKKNNVKFLTIENVPRAISEDASATLVLQSDQNEGIFFDIGKKLKSVFFKDLKIIFLSFDYQIRSDAIKAFSTFLQAPCSVETIFAETRRISENKKSILLIDDSKLVHKNLVGPLIESGFIVEQAFDGKEGLEMAIKKVPDLVICDIEMPVMNGFQACAGIRADPKTENTYIIMSSTLKSAEDQRKGFAAGVDEYLPKPVVFEGLVERIKIAFSRQSSLREKILIIQNDQKEAEIISNSLGQQGFSTRVASSIPEARRLLKKFSSDLILSEVNPTEGSIIDVSNLCKLDYTNSDLAFISLVDQNNNADRRMALNAGAQDTVATPMTSEALAAIVERTIASLRSKRERAEFQRYVSKASFQAALEKSVLSEISTQSRAENRNAIIFFMDIAQFTGRCERYGPKEIVSQINNMFERITEIIHQNGGDIDKFIGDACMAFWFDEGEVDVHFKSLCTILEIQVAISELNASNSILKDDPLRIRMGLNSGEVVLCDLGASMARVDLTMIGDAVNISARLESACSKYGIDNLIAGSVISDVEENFIYRTIDKILVKGKNKPVSCYELVSHFDKASKNEKLLAKEFNGAFEEYSKGNFEVAKDMFGKSAQKESSEKLSINPSIVYIDRCTQLIKSPPVNWDGVWVHDSK